MTATITTTNAAAILAANLDRLGERDQRFAVDLLQAARHNRASDKQWHWIEVLAKRAAGVEERPSLRVADDLTGVLALFDKAGAKLARPVVTLSDPQAGAIRITVAGERARVPGSLNVTTAGAYEEREWLGRIHRDGRWELSRTAGDRAGPVGALLARFAADPATVSAEHGRTTGHCSYCSLPLKDERSLKAGYGQTCAKNYALPWGRQLVG